MAIDPICGMQVDEETGFDIGRRWRKLLLLLPKLSDKVPEPTLGREPIGGHRLAREGKHFFSRNRHPAIRKREGAVVAETL